MKAQQVLLFAVLLVALFAVAFARKAAPAQKPDFSLERTDYHQMFNEWKEYYGKSYATPEEESLRFYNFVGKIHRCQHLNQVHNTPGLYGITPFSDMSSAEFKDKYLMKNSIPRPVPVNSSVSIDALIALTNPNALKIKSVDGKEPTTGFAPNTLYDWGGNGYTTAVKNQGGCGSCWAFSATEQVESNWAIKNGLPAPLAPQQIVDCDTGDGGCNGGWPQNAYKYIQSAGGLETEANYPYTGVDGTCNANGQKVVQITGSQYVGQGDETAMYNFLSGGGPLSICLNADNMESYTGNNQILPASTCNPNSVDHCVQLTGWLTDSNGAPLAWNVRNSWGAGWGNSGYALLQYGANACNLDCNPTIVTV